LELDTDNSENREMKSYEGDRSTVGRILTWIVIGVLAIVAIKVALALAGMVLGFTFVALFTIGPVVLIGWLIVKALRHFSRDPYDATV
jgi:hypothetical protein